MYKVSILISVYNKEKYLKQAIESALSQTYPNKEIILLDDNSTDNSLNIAKEYPIVIYSNERNMGQAYTKNKLASLSTGDYIQYLDADDYLNENKITLQLNNNNNDDLLIDNWLILFENNLYLQNINIYRPLEILKLKIKIQTNCFLVKRNIFNFIKWQDEVSQDTLFFLDCIKNKLKIKFTNNYSSTYRKDWSEHQITHNTNKYLEVNKKIEKEVELLYLNQTYIEYNKLIEVINSNSF